MKKIVSIIIGIVFLLTITGCSNNQNGKTINTQTTDGINYGNKITNLSSGLTKRNKLVIIAKNNNDFAVDITFKVDFFDANNALISSENASLNAVGGGAEVAVLINNTPINYSRFEISEDAYKTVYIKTYYKDISFTHNKKDKVIVNLKNNTKDLINYATVAIVYYQGENVIGYDSNGVFDIKPGNTTAVSFYQPTDEAFNELEYDNYKIYVNESYSYNN